MRLHSFHSPHAATDGFAQVATAPAKAPPPAPASVVALPPATVDTSTPLGPLPAALPSSNPSAGARIITRSSSPSPLYEYSERKIRKSGQKYGYFIVPRSSLVDEGPFFNSASQPQRGGDICVTKHEANSEMSTWVRSVTGVWERGCNGHSHPTLPGYVLHSQGGVARWVQAKSIQTYGYRKRGLGANFV